MPVELTARPWITAGCAAATVVSVGAIVAPVAAPPTALPDMQTRAVQLVDVSWDQVVQTALANATDIYDHLAPATFADVQQFAANVPDYLDDTRSFNADLATAFTAATTPFTSVDPEPYIYSSLDTTPSNISIDSILGHLFDIPLPGKDGLLNILTNGLNVDLGITTINIPVLSDLVGAADAAKIEPYLPFSGSPLSGILWGGIGTTLSPYLQFNDDITGISAALDGANPDYPTAFDDLLNMPANLTNAFLNGYGDVNLDTVLTDLGIATPPTDVALTADLGGLLSPAGSLIDGIGFNDTIGDCSVVCATLNVPETAVGPLASLFEQDQAIAESIGWDGVGQPLAHLFTELTSLF
jgi:hypothetical protein